MKNRLFGLVAYKFLYFIGDLSSSSQSSHLFPGIHFHFRRDGWASKTRPVGLTSKFQSKPVRPPRSRFQDSWHILFGLHPIQRGPLSCYSGRSYGGDLFRYSGLLSSWSVLSDLQICVVECRLMATLPFYRRLNEALIVGSRRFSVWISDNSKVDRPGDRSMQALNPQNPLSCSSKMSKVKCQRSHRLNVWRLTSYKIFWQV